MHDNWWLTTFTTEALYIAPITLSISFIARRLSPITLRDRILCVKLFSFIFHDSCPYLATRRRLSFISTFIISSSVILLRFLSKKISKYLTTVFFLQNIKSYSEFHFYSNVFFLFFSHINGTISHWGDSDFTFIWETYSSFNVA